MECAFWSWGLHGGNGAFKAFILTAFFSVWILGPSSAQISSVTPFPKDSRTGSTVLLSVQVTGNIRSFAWYRGTDTANQILSYIPGTTPPQETFPPYTGRVMGFPNGSMEITNLTPGDSGNYTVIIQFPSPTGTRSARVEINVYENVTQPTVQYSSSQLVENRGPAVITCNTSSAAETIHWYFNGKPFLPDNTRVTLTDKNRTLTIANVSRSDSGIYQCQAINPVSNSTSDPRTLTVAYGPQNVKIDPPGDQILQAGTKLTLTCTAASFPDPTYQWFLNNKDFNQPTRTLTVQRVSSQDEGNYTCVAHNTLTGLSPNATVYIAVNGTNPTQPGSSNGLSGGAIAGIVVGVLAFSAVVAGLVYYFVFMKPATGPSTSVPMQSTPTEQKNTEALPNTKANGNAEEIQYSSVNFVPKAAPSVKPTNENTVYSEVRR